MSEQGNEFDVEGHRVYQVDGPEDTEGHIVLGDNPIEDEDDVEAHVQPPRDTDLGHSPR